MRCYPLFYIFCVGAIAQDNVVNGIVTNNHWQGLESECLYEGVSLNEQ